MCFSAAVLCPIFAIPSLIIGGVAASTSLYFFLFLLFCSHSLKKYSSCPCLSDWNQTSYGSPSPHERGQTGMILPIALQHLCPYFISVAGVGALAASVMSSVDSALLSAASMLGRNVFKNIIYKKARKYLRWYCNHVVLGVQGVLSTLTNYSTVVIWCTTDTTMKFPLQTFNYNCC